MTNQLFFITMPEHIQWVDRAPTIDDIIKNGEPSTLTTAPAVYAVIDIKMIYLNHHTHSFHRLGRFSRTFWMPATVFLT